MQYPIEIKNKAKKLRKKGYSIKEIAKLMTISSSTASLWVASIELNEKALKRLEKRKVLGQYKAIQTRKQKQIITKASLDEKNLKLLSELQFTPTLCKLLCSIFFWTEGGKFTDSYVYFINSDPKMIKTFMKLFRLSFEVDESKLRALIHIHEYHHELKIKRFWSDIAGIPVSRFSKSYLKPHTARRIRDGYMGSLRIRYYDYKIALELRSTYNMLTRYLGV